MKKVHLALKPDKNPDQMLAEKAALEDYLAGKLNRAVEVIIPLNSTVITEGFANGTIDLGYLSAIGAAKAIKQGVADILLAGEIEGKPYYLSYWVTLKEKPYQGVEDLRGQPIAFSSRTSTSGFIIPVWDLYKKGYITIDGGPEGYFGEGNVYYGVGYVSAVQRVFEGQAEAAAVSYYVLDKDKHLTSAQRGKLKKITSQGPVPTHTIALRNSLKETDRELLRATLLAMNEDNPELRDKVFNSKLIVVDPDKHLEAVREALDLVSQIKF